MDTEKLNQAQNDKMTAQEAVYLVDRAVLLHLKEVQGGDFEYAVFDKQTKGKVTEGRIIEDNVLDSIDPTHDHLAAARGAAIKEAGLDGIEVAQVGLTSLKEFSTSDIRRRQIWEPETLPKDDIRFIDSHYNEQFRIPNGSMIQVEYPDWVVSIKCEYIDDYHAYIGREVYHMCQFAEALERNGGVCRPEPVLDADRAAWKIGVRACLAVEFAAGYWDYKLFGDHLNVTKSGKLELVGFSINEVRDMILAENQMDGRSMFSTDYNLLMAKAAAQKEQVQTDPKTASEHKPSIRGQLAAAKAAQADKPAAQQRQKDKEVR